VWVEAALTTTRRASTARWSGFGKQGGEVYVRNQRLKAPQSTHQLESGGSGLGCNAQPGGVAVGRTPGSGEVAGREATVKVCGVAVAMLQGHSWVPIPPNGSAVNVGTVPMVPKHGGCQPRCGKARRLPTPSGRGGGPVVVRGRESRSHGEGVQRDRGKRSWEGDHR
jgi:hypothetical protein